VAQHWISVSATAIFSGSDVTVAEEPNRLAGPGNSWVLGPCSEIEFLLTGKMVALKSRYEIKDSISATGVHELEAGWADFLSRLHRRIETEKNSRYRWSERSALRSSFRQIPKRRSVYT